MIDVGRICVYCGKICSNHAGSLNYHVNRCIKNPNCMESYRQKTIKCEKCGVEFSVKHNDKRRFCSRSCANGHVLTNDTKKKIQDSLWSRYGHSIKYCSQCGNVLSNRNKTGLCVKCSRRGPLSEETKQKIKLALNGCQHNFSSVNNRCGYGIIYLIRNKMNGKTYVGQHIGKDSSVLSDGYMGSGVYIKHAVNKYGKHLFEKEILYEYDGISVSALNEVERYYIWLGRTSGKCEYNIASGGIGAVK